MRGSHFLETAEGGTCQNTERSDRTRGTHSLETVGGGICQDMGRKPPSERHPRTKNGRGSYLSEHGIKTFKREHSLPGNGRRKNMSGQKESDQSGDTHCLETAERGACQGTKRNRPSEEHSLPGDGRRTNLSGHGKKAAKRRTLTTWRRQRERPVRTRKKATNRGVLTL